MNTSTRCEFREGSSLTVELRVSPIGPHNFATMRAKGKSVLRRRPHLSIAVPPCDSASIFATWFARASLELNNVASGAFRSTPAFRCHSATASLHILAMGSATGASAASLGAVEMCTIASSTSVEGAVTSKAVVVSSGISGPVGGLRSVTSADDDDGNTCSASDTGWGEGERTGLGGEPRDEGERDLDSRRYSFEIDSRARSPGEGDTEGEVATVDAGERG